MKVSEQRQARGHAERPEVRLRSGVIPLTSEKLHQAPPEMLILVPDL